MVVLGDPHGDIPALKGIIEHETRPDTEIVSVGDNIGYKNGDVSSEFCSILEERRIRSVFGNHEDWCIKNGGELVIANGPGQMRYHALKWCSQLPFRLRIEFLADPAFRVTIVHTIETYMKGGEWRDGVNDFAWEFVGAENVRVFTEKEGADVIFCGHSHGPAFYEVSPEGATMLRLNIVPKTEPEFAEIEVNAANKYVVDAGSLGRPGYHPDEGDFSLGSYAVLNVTSKTIRLVSFKKG